MGWTNDQTDVLVLPTGATSGARIVINGITDAILVYDSAGDLVEAISPNGGTDQFGNVYDAGFWTFNPSDKLSMSMDNAGIEWFFVGVSDMAGGIGYGTGSDNAALITIISGNFTGQPGPQSAMFWRSDDGIHPAVVLAQQEQATGTGIIIGSVVQNDDDNALTSNKFVHTGIASVTVGALGTATWAHGASFTPTMGTVSPLTGFWQWSINSPFGVDGFTATDGQLIVRDQSGNLVANGTNVAFSYIVLG